MRLHPAFLLSLILSTTLLFCGNKNESDFGEPPPEKIGDLLFFRNPDQAIKKSKAEDKPLFIDFYADWCINCKRFNELAKNNRELSDALAKNAVLLKIYDTDPAFENYKKNPDFKELNIGLPLFVVQNPDGSLKWKTMRYKDTKGMIQAVQ